MDLVEQVREMMVQVELGLTQQAWAASNSDQPMTGFSNAAGVTAEKLAETVRYARERLLTWYYSTNVYIERGYVQMAELREGQPMYFVCHPKDLAGIREAVKARGLALVSLADAPADVVLDLLPRCTPATQCFTESEGGMWCAGRGQRTISQGSL